MQQPPTKAVVRIRQVIKLKCAWYSEVPATYLVPKNTHHLHFCVSRNIQRREEEEAKHTTHKNVGRAYCHLFCIHGEDRAGPQAASRLEIYRRCNPGYSRCHLAWCVFNL